MNRTEEIVNHFESLGVTQLSDEVVSKCLEICEVHSVDTEEFVERWVAYSISNLGGDCPTLETLQQMERKEFTKKEVETGLITTPKQHGSLVIYNSNSVDNLNDDDLLNVYRKTPKTSEKQCVKSKTPEVNNLKPTKLVFSPASFSPTTSSVSEKYKSRTNSGNVVSVFGNKTQWISDKNFQPSIHPYNSEFLMPGDIRFMFEQLRMKGEILDDRVGLLGKTILQKSSLVEDEVENPKMPHANEFLTYGVVSCDAMGRLNPNSVILGTSRGVGSASSVPLDVKNLTKFALFPGQVIAVEGLNPNGSKLVAKQVFCDASLSLPKEIPLLNQETGPLQLIIASGPFTMSDTMAYQPLEDLLIHINQHKPHIVILIGPFIDANHPHVAEGLLAETFFNMFEKLIENIVNSVSGNNTQIVMISSSRDVNCQMVYPTPPFILRKKSSRLHLMPDPCVLSINGVVIGVTATDILLHLGKEEIASQQSSDRLGRLAAHVLQQQNFYPLFPPAEELNIDLELWEKYSNLDVSPHILILPSDLRYFIKRIGDSVVVNPERLAKGVVGGSFAKLEINIPQPNSTLADCINGAIVKI